VRSRALAVALLAALAVLVLLPAEVQAHAVLERTTPSASATTSTPPKEVSLTFSEGIEPRFAIVSVTDAGGHQVADGPPAHPPGDGTTLVVPLKDVKQGWYLVYWRVISADGHPVRGAFTFAVGPSPGPAPQFPIPSLNETAATPTLVIERWAMLLSLMIGVGLLLFRLVIARPVVSRVEGASLRPVGIAAGVALAICLIATPVYLIQSTAEFALRSATDLGGLIPLVRRSSFGRAILDLEIVVALLIVCAVAAGFLDRPKRAARSVVELIALFAVLGTAAAALLIPGIAGHPATTSPAGLAMSLDWVHLASGSVWVGGLVGLLLLGVGAGRENRRAVLGVVVPRFSRVALVAILLIIGTGVGASLLHLPTLDSLWTTSYGRAILVKVALLCGALSLAAVNLLVTRPALRDELTKAWGAIWVRRLAGGEMLLAAGIVAAAAVLTSVAPPSKALGKLGSNAHGIGPGPVSRTVKQGPYTATVSIKPNRAALPNTFTLELGRGGRPVTGAQVTATFDMLDMDMQQLAYTLPEASPGRYTRQAPALVMVGHWGITLRVTPKAGRPFELVFRDRAGG
jgi:copper transport protein